MALDFEVPARGAQDWDVLLNAVLAYIRSNAVSRDELVPPANAAVEDIAYNGSDYIFRETVVTARPVVEGVVFYRVWTIGYDVPRPAWMLPEDIWFAEKQA